MIPRWRSFRATAAGKELAAIRLAAPQDLSALRIDNKREEWLARKDIPSAVTLVEAAAVAGGPLSEVERAAAEFLSEGATPATLTVKQLASSLLRGMPGSPPLVGRPPQDLIKTYKRRLRINPRDALMWVDLARLYSSFGQNRQAIQSIEAAIAIDPNNRFVLRSAARLFVHVGEQERAHRILARAESTSSDPWLIAAELATATLIQKPARFTRTGQRLVESRKFGARDTTELFSALGTLEIEHGKSRQARKLFDQSLRDPNDNSLAQANWAAEKHKVGSVEPELVEKVPLAFEAATWQAFWSGEWSKSLDQSLAWAEDEPFSSAPACHGSFLALSILDQPLLAEQIAVNGLRANPNDPTLKNNLLVALAIQGRVEKAEEIFTGIKWQDEKDPHRYAAEGLILSRKGRVWDAASKYVAAMDAARNLDDRLTWARAGFHLLKEIDYWSPVKSTKIRGYSDAILKSIRTPELEHYRSTIGRPSNDHGSTGHEFGLDKASIEAQVELVLDAIDQGFQGSAPRVQARK